MASSLDAQQMRDLGDHSAHRRSILQLTRAADLVQPQPSQRRALVVTAADRAAALSDYDGRLIGGLFLFGAGQPDRGLLGRRFLGGSRRGLGWGGRLLGLRRSSGLLGRSLGSRSLLRGRLLLSRAVFRFGRHQTAPSCSLVPASGLPRMSPIFFPRRAATTRGLTTDDRAASVALTMLCGLDVPIDFATTSWTPSASNTARIGPPAMIPVPAGAARMTTCPAPKWPFRS